MNRTAEFPEDRTAGEEIQRYLTQFLPQLNFRLLMETDLSSRNILWVESVAVTAYQSAPAAAGGAAKAGRLPGRIWNRLMGMSGKVRPLRNKKERR